MHAHSTFTEVTSWIASRMNSIIILVPMYALSRVVACPVGFEGCKLQRGCSHAVSQLLRRHVFGICPTEANEEISLRTSHGTVAGAGGQALRP